MSPDDTMRAAEAIVAYRRGEGPANPYARDLCRRLAGAVHGGGTVGPLTGGPAFLALALHRAAASDPAVRSMIRELSRDAGAGQHLELAAPSQAVNVRGNGNNVTVSGRDTHILNGIQGESGSAGPRHARRESDAPRTTILFAAAAPGELASLRTDLEMREAQEALDLSAGRDRFKLELRPALRPRDFARALLQLKPRVVHFAGHGTQYTGELCFQDEIGSSQPASAEGLRRLFSGLGGVVECVVLNACYSAGNSAALAQAVPHVIAWKQAVSDDAAISFAIGFYQGLGDGMEIPQAYEWACSYMEFAGVDDVPPELVRGAGVSPSARAVA